MAGEVILGGMSRAGQQNGQEMSPQTAQIARKPGIQAPHTSQLPVRITLSPCQDLHPTTRTVERASDNNALSQSILSAKSQGSFCIYVGCWKNT